MFRVMLWSQWKWSRLIVLPGAVAGFALPILSVQGAAAPGGSPDLARELLSLLQRWGVLYPVLAALLGLLVAMAAWASDHRGRHVHALILPLPRWRYALLKFGAGLAVLLIPILALTVGTLFASASASIPAGLQSYPLALAGRFALAVLIAFSLFFAISSGTARTAGLILGSLGLVILVQVLASVANLDFNLVFWLQRGLLSWPGPLAIFGGRWMLIDV